jgi:NitT/TauT family transport system permease protein
MNRAWRASEGARSVVAVIAGTLLLWEICVHVFALREFIAPAPSVVLQGLIKNPSFYFQHALWTLWVALAGFGLAVVFGMVFAIGIIHSVWLERTLYTLLVALNSLPKVALAPLFVIWFGTGSASKTAVVISIAIFPIVIDAVLGLRSVDPEVINMARAMRASRAQILWKIRFPQALPSLFAGMKVSISLALVGTIVGEFVAGNQGLGSAILAAQATFDTPQVFASILLLAVLGALLFYAVDFIERRFIPWHPSHRRVAEAATNSAQN